MACPSVLFVLQDISESKSISLVSLQNITTQGLEVEK